MRMILPLMLAGLVFTSCAPSTPQARIQREPAKFQALGEKHRGMVEQGQIARGMSTDAVYLAWGAPSRAFQGFKNGKTTERWDYAGSQPVYFNTFYGGYGGYGGPYGPRGRYGYHGYGFGIGPEVAYIPYRVASVWFIDGRVDSWERAH